MDLKELQQQSVAEIQKSLGDLERDQLTELLALEADSNSPRETLTKAIANRLEKMDIERGESTGAADADPDAPAHQDPAYKGPLTIEQADWRNHHIKPAQVAKQK